MWRFSIATKQQIAGFPTISDKVIFPTIVKPLISNKNVQNRPESEQFREMLGVFLFSKSKFANRAAGKEVMQMPRMPKYLKREWAFFLGDCGRKKYNPLPSDKLLKGAQLICNKPFFRIFARLNIQNTDFVFVRHCNNSFFDDKNTAVSGDTAGDNKYKVSGSLCVRWGRLLGDHIRRHKPWNSC
mgnify:FL=1